MVVPQFLTSSPSAWCAVDYVATRKVKRWQTCPPERVTPAPLFTYTGMDVFGPFYIKEGRKEMKRWGLIFNCLSSRAIHLETLNSMTTDSFLNALRRFTSCRGKVCDLRSDQETNLIGTMNELSAALKELDTAPLKEFLSSQDCDLIDFNLNIPQASHLGGTWERQIRTTRPIIPATGTWYAAWRRSSTYAHHWSWMCSQLPSPNNREPHRSLSTRTADPKQPADT